MTNTNDARDGLPGDHLHRLQKFVDWEKTYRPLDTHIAEWALEEINRLRCEFEAALATQQPAAVDGPVYGIIDPDYARIFTIARTLAWSEGYALAMQGSFTRDLDLIATPWTEAACAPEHLAERIADAADLKLRADDPGLKPHGRLAWTLHLPDFGDPRWVDLSIMPRAALAQPQGCA